MLLRTENFCRSKCKVLILGKLFERHLGNHKPLRFDFLIECESPDWTCQNFFIFFLHNENKLRMGLKQYISTLVSVRFLKCLSIHSLIVPIDNFYNISLNENEFKQN